MKNPSLAQCKKLIEQEKYKDYKPTISHYRDMKNGIKTKINPQLESQYIYAIQNDIVYLANQNDASNRLEIKKLLNLLLQQKDVFSTKQKLYLRQLREQVSKESYSNYRYLGATFLHRLNDAKNPTRKAITKNSESALMSLLDKIYDAETRLNSAVYIPYLSSAEQSLIKKYRSKYFTIKDGGKGVMLSSAGVKALGYTQPLGKKNPQTKAVKNPEWRTQYNDNDSSLEHKELKSKGYLISLFKSTDKASKDVKYWAQVFSPNGRKLTFSDTNTYSKSINALSEAKEIINAHIKRGKRPNPTRQNYDEQAIFETHIDETLDNHSAMFQGAITGKTVKAVGSDYTNAQTSRLGKLAQIIIIDDNGNEIELKPKRDAWLSMDIRKNLQLSGRGVQLNKKQAKLPPKGELFLAGRIKQIDYITNKSHIEKGQTVRYYHELGEVTGELPTLWFDSDGMPVIIGGNYDVWKSGIVN